MKRILQNGALVLMGITAALLIAEAALRLMPWGHWAASDPLPPRHYFRADPAAGHDIGENAGLAKFPLGECALDIWGNELGCFDHPYRGEDPFILLVGDSFSWGYVPLEEHWGKLVEKWTGIRVLSCGVPGYGTKNAFLKARRVIEKVNRKPQAIILGYCVNDPIDDYLHPRYRVVDGYSLEARSIVDFSEGTIRERTEGALQAKLDTWRVYGAPEAPRHPRWERFRRILSESSATYRLIQPALSDFKAAAARLLGQPADRAVELSPAIQYANLPFRPEGELPWLDDAWRDHLAHLGALHRWAEKNGIRLFVMIIPMREQVYTFFPGAESRGDDGPTRRVREFLEREKIPHADLLPLFRRHADQRPRRSLDSRKDLYRSSDSHWSPRGNRLAGLAVAEHLVEQRLVDVPDDAGRLREIRGALASF